MNITWKNLSIITLIFYAFVLQNVYGAVMLDRVVAVVNNEIITWTELRSVVALEGKEVLDRLPEDQKEEAIKEFEEKILYNLIDLKLQLQQARKIGLDLSDAEINSAIADIKNKFDLTDEVLLNSLKAEGLNLDEYKKKLGEQIMVTKIVNHEVKTNIVITDREIGDYYEANKNKFSKKEKRRIRQIFFPAPKETSQKSFIESKAQEVIQRIKKGEDFSRLAAEFSDDNNRQFDGDLGYIRRGDVLREIEDTAFSLNVGEVSKPFWSPAGLHIIKVDDKVEAEGLDNVRDKIKEILFQQAFESKYIEWKAGLKEKAYIEIKL